MSVFLCSSSKTSALKSVFLNYLPALIPFPDTAPKSHEDYLLCCIFVGFMDVLIKDLHSTILHPSFKRPILFFSREIALALEPWGLIQITKIWWIISIKFVKKFWKLTL
ncbi:uncharacterized protein VP01_1349g3 [Puccinia sorghi]|uniref:Uncharacterized protein n=1 Tax=Puccinia sorghi TaxID=27349 RepID=A0A0L6VNX8_9BASI|nr:uncharacterized protein VP01_1349g3 [Puccinia sorghi]